MNSIEKIQDSWVCEGSIESPPDKVYAFAVEYLKREWKKMGEEYTPEHFSADADKRSISMRGGWWYNAVYTIKPDPKGSCITYRVHNIAPRDNPISAFFRPFMSFQHRNLKAQMKIELDNLLQAAAQLSSK